MVFFKPSGPYRISNYTVRELLRFAYSLDDDHILGLPPWADTERFDIEQQFATEPAAGEVQALVRDLLALQFNLTTHVEQRDVPAFVLVRTGAQLGPRLRASAMDCIRQPITGPAGVMPCQLRLGEQGIYGVGMTMARFASELSGSGYVRLDRPVVDRTGLTGTFDMEMSVVRLERRQAQQAGGNIVVTSVRSELPFPTILERELGLALESGSAPQDVMVVDRLTPPTLAPPLTPRPPGLRIVFARQQTSAPEPAFEVASVKQNTSGVLRQLLADRFQLVTRIAVREQPVFALTTAASDRRAGSRLRPGSPAECIDRGSGPVRVPPGELPSCGALRAGPGRISGRSVTMVQFIGYLTPRVERVAIDRTDMPGLLDIDLEWTPDAGRRAALERDFGASVAVDANVPEVFTALREQLGLTLERTTAPVEVLVIERAGRPTEN
jgi:uncharacterized protein (TIGR03435 family)